MMTKHLATVKQMVDALGIRTQARQVIIKTGTAEFWDVYNIHHYEIDQLLKTLYGSYVLSDVSSPDETTEDDIHVELARMSQQFVIACEEPLRRLWMLETVDFNPVENYDRYETLSHVKTGSEEVTGKDTANNNDVKADTGVDTSTTTQTGNVTSTNSGGVSSEENTSDTSYNTNLINTVSSNSTDTTKTVTEYNKLQTQESNEKGTTTTLTHKVDETHNESRTYKDVTDAENNHIHGNIGVSTATSMMNEYVSFYDSYSFWVKFWEMYIKLFASPIFETDRSYYV